MQERGQDGGQDNGLDGGRPELQEGEYRRIGAGPAGFQPQPGWPTATQAATTTATTPMPMADPEPPIKRRGTNFISPDMLPSAPSAQSSRKYQLILGGLALVVLIALIAAAVHSSAPTRSRTASSTATAAMMPGSTETSAPNVPDTPALAAAPATTQAPPPPAQTTTYSCTGHASDGVNITYGAEGSNTSADHLPFSATVPLDANAQYFNITAQLQGNGTVTCSTVVNWTDDSGNAQSVTQTGTASGGYNLASAEICGDFEGGWQTC